MEMGISSIEERTPLNCYTGVYEENYSKWLHNRYSKLNVLGELHRQALNGRICSPALQTYLHSTYFPDVALWALTNRSDLYCGFFDSTGDNFYSASQDGVVRVFDSTQRYFSLKHEFICHEHSWSVVSMVLSPDEKVLAFSSLSPRVNIVSLDKNPGDYSSMNSVTLQQGSAYSDTTFSICFNNDGSKLIAGLSNGRLCVCDIQTQASQPLTTGGRYNDDVNAVTLTHPSAHTFLAGGDDTSIRLFDLRALNKGSLAVFTGHFDGITYLDAKEDGIYFLSNSKDQMVKLWDLRNHSMAGTERRSRPRVIWDYRIHEIPRSYLGPNSGTPKPTGDRGDKSVLTLTGHVVQHTLIRVRFSPAFSTGQRFAYAGSAVGDWHIWDLLTGKVVARNYIRSVALRDVHWHPYEPIAMTSSLNGTLTCWTHNPSASNIQNIVPETPLSVGKRPRRGPATNVWADTCLRKKLLPVHSAENTDGDQKLCENDEEVRFAQSDPFGDRYRLKLAVSGFRYNFPNKRRRPNLLYINSLTDPFGDDTDTDDESWQPDVSYDSDSDSQQFGLDAFSDDDDESVITWESLHGDDVQLFLTVGMDASSDDSINSLLGYAVNTHQRTRARGRGRGQRRGRGRGTNPINPTGEQLRPGAHGLSVQTRQQTNASNLAQTTTFRGRGASQRRRNSGRSRRRY